MTVPSFAAAHDSSRQVCVWLKGSPKRAEVFQKCFKDRETVLVPTAPAKSRFGTHLLQMQRTEALLPAMATFNLRIEADEPGYSSFKEFQSLYASVIASRPILRSVASHLVEPVMACIAAVGSDTSYTSSLRYDVFEKLWAAGDELRAVDATKAVGIRFQSSLLQRIGTHHLASSYFEEGVHERPDFLKPSFPHFAKKLNEDAHAFACMLLDPACAPHALNRCPDSWQADFTAYLYNEVIRPAATIVSAAPPPPSAASTSKSKLAAEIAAIKSRPKPKAMGDATWATMQEADIDAAKERYESRGDKVTGADGEPLSGAPADPYMPLFYQLAEEVKLHFTFLHEMRAAASAGGGGGAAAAAAGGAGAAAKAPPASKSPFGDPLSHGTAARYEYWPSRRAAQRLMLFCAEELLAASRAATAFNERLHNPAQRIGCKLRNRLKPRTTEQLTLAYHYVREDVKKKVKEMGAEAERLLDLEDLEDAGSDDE
jgi:hypothetical protein